MTTAIVLALVATSAVYLYVRAERNAARVSDSIAVLVATRDIPAGADLDSLISEGAFATKYLPSEALVRDAVSNLRALEGHRTTSAVLEGQQMSSAYLEGDASAIAGGTLGIPDGMEGVSIALDASRVVGGDLHTGDYVTIFASFDGAQSASVNGSGSQTGEVQITAGGNGPVTAALVEEARVLKVTPPDDTAGTGPEATTLVTLALTPKDVQRLVYAQENGSVWLALLPPNGTVRLRNPIHFRQVLK